jgi:MipA family protein
LPEAGFNIQAMRFFGFVLTLVLGLALAQARAQEQVTETAPTSVSASAASLSTSSAVQRPFDYAIGIAANYKPSYSGSAREDWDIKPSLGLRWGRFRISSGGAGRLLGFGNDAGAGSGASADLLSTERVQVRLSLRSESGRSSSTDPGLAGQPDVRRTLRARLSAGYSLNRNWGVQAAWSNDLLGRGGGALVDLGLGWSHWLSSSTQLSAGAGITWADSTYLRSYYGTPGGTSSPYPRFTPNASVYSTRVSVGTTTALSRRWLVFTSLGYGHLLGDAARSPLTRQDGAASFTMGLAYRCCSMGP